jgi:hypothetical protein
MPLTTKNNAIIVKDGKIAQDCACCKIDCRSKPSQITVTITGLPRGCTNQFDTYTVGDLSNWNGCSFTLYQQNSNRCVYLGTLSGFGTGAYYECSTSWTVGLNIERNRLVLDEYVTVIPADGALFGNLPFSGSVVAESPSRYTLCDFSNLSVTIDTSTPSYSLPECEPFLGSRTYAKYGVTCPPCEASSFSCPDGFDDGAYPELTANLTFGELAVASSSDNLQTSPGMKSMSGSYALRWSTRASRFPNISGVYNSDWTFASVGNSDELRPLLPPGGVEVGYAGCGWYGLFVSTPYGEVDSGKGYELVYGGRTPPKDTQLAAIQIAFVPMGWHIPYDVSTKQLTRTRCENGDVSFQLRVKCYAIPTGLADTGFGYYRDLSYWSAPLAVFTFAPCKSWPCRSKSSFSLSQKVYGFQRDSRISCDVSVNIS